MTETLCVLGCVVKQSKQNMSVWAKGDVQVNKHV